MTEAEIAAQTEESPPHRAAVVEHADQTSAPHHEQPADSFPDGLVTYMG